MPVRERVAPDEARRRFALPVDKPVLLVFGGSQGAAAVNEIAVIGFAVGGPSVLHLCGERYLAELTGRVSRPDYRLLGWTDDFGVALDACDLVLARAGGSVWEVAVAGKPAVLVPSPNVTADHQTKNARYFEHAGGAVVVPEPEIERVPGIVHDLLACGNRLTAMGEAMRLASKPGAAEKIAEELIGLGRA